MGKISFGNFALILHGGAAAKRKRGLGKMNFCRRLPPLLQAAGVRANGSLHAAKIYI